ncbi:putative aldouronate transport system permease protein [Paenibacillus sp. UNCCL117]|uniref:carbohydrate ABC transporter permease n=1 Tax=unclassified Paenibacillus TaxID=185978 RepID=UPI00088EAE12|nr:MULTISPECIES: carbohydrate ABC transporter permease [unclassified Paenibacillus]SDC90565.1 putative aldouronate transport system permease protein [Paenibacillus sp. cl123]SFW28877.1 putative aldouronate transport system permease protein [Paenibacillus sp. UNCCL117]
MRWKRIELFDIVNYVLIVLTCIGMLYPFVNVAAVSLSSYTAFVANPMLIWPKDFTFGAYEEILSHPILWKSYLNTIIVTVSGVIIGVFLYLITAYPLSKSHLRGRRIFMLLIVFTMLFNGGLIPNFYLMRSLGLLDSLAALILPALMSGFSLILMKNFMESLPEELEEAARIDGASEPYILFRVVFPLSMPIVATLGLFAAVGYWNNFFNGIVYIRSVEKWPLMLFLREIIEGSKMMEISTAGNAAELGAGTVPTETLKYATLMIVMLPILCVYPFLQKYFVKGLMLGSVKG